MEAQEIILAANPIRAGQELRGETNSEQRLVFKQWIWQLRANPRYTLSCNPQVIYTFIDPATGSECSDLGIASAVHENDRDRGIVTVNVAMSVYECDSGNQRVGSELQETIERHFASMESRPRYSTAYHIVFFEQNDSTALVSMWATCVEKTLGRNRCIIYRGIKKNKRTIGVFTDNRVKLKEVMYMKSLLRDNKLLDSSVMCGVNPDGAILKRNEQLERWAEYEDKKAQETTSVVLTQPKMTWNGKGPNGTLKDDEGRAELGVCWSMARVSQLDDFQLLMHQKKITSF